VKEKVGTGVSTSTNGASAEADPTVVITERVFSSADSATFAVLTLAVVAAMVALLWYWLSLSDRRSYPLAFTAASLLLLFYLGSWLSRWLSLPAMRRPRPMLPEPGLRVAAVTTFVPSAEPLEMLEQTLLTLVAMDYPHDTWVLDEGSDEAVKSVCRRLGVRHFTRKGRPEYQTESGSFQRDSKHGNYNAWLDSDDSRLYDIVVAFDPDHIPERQFLTSVLGYFRDPGIAYAQAPQFYYNQSASFIARGAAEETYAYYSTHLMASYALGHPILIGSHSTQRMTALRDVGGFAAHDADDLLITLQYRAKGWRGVYVPDILAMGITPVEWHGYLRQQVRWARSLLDIKFRMLPSFAGHLSKKDQVLGALHGAFYLRSLTIPAMYVVLVYLMLIGGNPAFLSARTLTFLGGIALLLMTAERFRRRFYLDPRHEGGLHWRAMVLQLAKWPFFVIAAWRALIGRAAPYALTQKVHSLSKRRIVMWPHLAVGVLLSASWVIAFVLNGVVAPVVSALTAAVVLFSFGVAWSELRRMPPPFESGMYTERRAQLRDKRGSPNQQ